MLPHTLREGHVGSSPALAARTRGDEIESAQRSVIRCYNYVVVDGWEVPHIDPPPLPYAPVLGSVMAGGAA